MATADLSTRLGPLELRSPLIAASGTVGNVADWSRVGAVEAYGAAVAKSVAPVPWPGRPPPRLAPVASGMLNGIGIQNPGVEVWAGEVGPALPTLGVPVWGSAVGHTPDEYSLVAKRLSDVGVAAVEINLSCPNLDRGEMFALRPELSAEVVESVVAVSAVPVGAKLSPDAGDMVSVAAACIEAGAEFLTIANTISGFGVDLNSRRPLLSGGVGGYSGPGLKPISLRCVYQVARELPGAPIVGCGGVWSGGDVVEYLLAGAAAVAMGTVHLAEPRAGARVRRELVDAMRAQGVSRVTELVGGVGRW